MKTHKRITWWASLSFTGKFLKRRLEYVIICRKAEWRSFIVLPFSTTARSCCQCYRSAYAVLPKTAQVILRKEENRKFYETFVPEWQTVIVQRFDMLEKKGGSKVLALVLLPPKTPGSNVFEAMKEFDKRVIRLSWEVGCEVKKSCCPKRTFEKRGPQNGVGETAKK